MATISPQVINEYYWVCLRKTRFGRAEQLIRADVAAMCALATAPFDLHVHIAAHAVRDRTGYGWWDCLLLSSALAAGCRHFLSEDLQHDHDVDGLRIINPFLVEPADVLGE